MGTTLKRLYVEFLCERYQGTKSRKHKSMIIDQLVRDTGFHRKHAIRALNQKPTLKKRRGRKFHYSDGARYHIQRLWLQMDQVNGRRMNKMLPNWLEHYHAKGFGPKVKDEILKMSPATIERILKRFRAQTGRRLRSGTKAAHIRSRIPLKNFDRNAAVPGYLEADTVAHCGDSMSGQFLWSLTTVDRYSGWTEVRAVWSKLSKAIVEELKDIEERVPFIVKGLATDNGTEFLNRFLIDYAAAKKGKRGDIYLTRSRPYKKNDQCYVEQKNHTHVRKLLGYDRLDCPQVTQLVNDLYRNEWSDYQNYFIPQVKLIEKIRVGGKYKRKHDEPETPHQRLMKSPQISEQAKETMERHFKTLNPFELKDRIETKLKQIWQMQKDFEQSQKLRLEAQ